MKKYYLAYMYYNMASRDCQCDNETVTLDGDIHIEANFKQAVEVLQRKHGHNGSRISIMNIVELL